ncbi:MAG: SDR family NAD(P)-dependent oxidoreductase [Sphingomonadaceae bacterium]|nr:SDR family NAD(P)-dependent oxidoreductase [Sphingomonadaceae bacterium]
MDARAIAENLGLGSSGAATLDRNAPAVVIGARGGIGRALAEALVAAEVAAVHALSRSGAEVAGAVAGVADVTDEASLAAAAERIGGGLGLVIVATGVLHGEGLAPERSWRAIDGAAMARVLAVNTIGPALVAKHFLPLLARTGKPVFAVLSARVGSIGDNRLGGWHSYRASKAALNMLIANFAIELRARNPAALAVGLHPGTVDTGLSAPFQRGVADGKLFSPAFSAERLLAVLDALRPQDSGGCFAWDGARIAP